MMTWTFKPKSYPPAIVTADNVDMAIQLLQFRYIQEDLVISIKRTDLIPVVTTTRWCRIFPE